MENNNCKGNYELYRRDIRWYQRPVDTILKEIGCIQCEIPFFSLKLFLSFLQPEKRMEAVLSWILFSPSFSKIYIVCNKCRIHLYSLPFTQIYFCLITEILGSYTVKLNSTLLSFFITFCDWNILFLSFVFSGFRDKQNEWRWRIHIYRLGYFVKKRRTNPITFGTGWPESIQTSYFIF